MEQNRPYPAARILRIESSRLGEFLLCGFSLSIRNDVLHAHILSTSLQLPRGVAFEKSVLQAFNVVSQIEQTPQNLSVYRSALLIPMGAYE